MSADFIGRLGSHNLGASPISHQGNAQVGRSADKPLDKVAETTAHAPQEGYAPTTEATESKEDAQAGEARASQIFSAWAPVGDGAATASAGSLGVQGAENTAVNQAYSATGSQPGGVDAGFTKATVYSSLQA